MSYHKRPINVVDCIPEGNIDKTGQFPSAELHYGLSVAIKPYLLWSKEDRWNYLLSMYGDEGALPDEIVEDIWGGGVLSARNAPHDCQACKEVAQAGPQLCGYHQSRCCPICGGVSSCKSWCP